MRRAALSLATAMLASACASPGQDLASFAQVARGDEREVKVRTPSWIADPYPIAAAHCERYGREAQLRETSASWSVFDCLAPLGPSHEASAPPRR